MIKAVGLLSGGLDSTLAAKLLIDMGIEVSAINFKSPFCTCTAKGAGCSSVATAVKQLGDIPLKTVALGDEYLEMIKNPRYGYGRGMNPCIDCRIMKIRKAADFMREIGAQFLFTGEVLGQRPMSQRRDALDIIDRDSGLRGLILRPLSAAMLAPTVPEQEGWVDRSKLLGITGRGRGEQFRLARERDINDFPCPAGGCLLTDERFAEKVRDYLAHADKPSARDIPLLRIGRHFRLGNGDKVVVTRNEGEGRMMLQLARPEYHLLMPRGFSGPVTLLQGSDIDAAVDALHSYTTRAIPAAASIIRLHRGQETEHPIPLQRRAPAAVAIGQS